VENIKAILAGVDDCAWLDERKRELSEKARLNAQQREEQARGKKKGKKGEAVVVEVDGASSSSAGPSASSAAPPTPTKATEKAAGESPLQRWLVQLVSARLSLSDFVPADWLGAVQNYLRSLGQEPSVSALAALEASSKLRAAITDAAATQESASSSGGAPRLSLDQLESWIVGAQVEAFHVIWRLVCGGGSERLRSALHDFRVRRPRDFRMWRNAPEGLLQGLLDCDATLAGIAYVWDASSPADSSSATAMSTAGLNVPRVAWICLIALGASAVFPWMDSEGLAEQSSGAEATAEEDEAGGAEEAGDDGEEELAWQYEPSASAHTGQRVRVEVDNGYWEDGAVVAYLPPEPDEPMALWKVRLDGRGPSAVARAGAGAGKKDVREIERCEDLEEHELLEAIERLARSGGESK
jgi:hypothetical protein